VAGSEPWLTLGRDYDAPLAVLSNTICMAPEVRGKGSWPDDRWHTSSLLNSQEN